MKSESYKLMKPWSSGHGKLIYKLLIGCIKTPNWCVEKNPLFSVKYKGKFIFPNALVTSFFKKLKYRVFFYIIF